MPTKDEPDCPSLSAQEQAPAVALCRDCYDGTNAVRAKERAYLPMFPLESEAGYRERLAQATLYNCFARTADGLAGMVMRKPPELGEDVPAEIRGKDERGTGGIWEDVSNAGAHGSVFAAERLLDALVDGHCGVFVDMPPRDESIATRADELAKSIRPYWVPVKKADILRWATRRIGGKQTLVYLAFKEITTERDGNYGEKRVLRVREYSLAEGRVSFAIHTKIVSEDKATPDKWVTEPGVMDAVMDEIPLAVVYGKRTGTLESKPPLLDLATENIRHYQLRSDFETTLHIAGVPIPWANGLQEGTTLKVGADSMISLPEGGECGYLEPTGASLAATSQEIQHTETRMAVQGLSFIQRDSAAAETATAKRLDKSEQDSALMRVAGSLQDALEEALRFTAKWMKLKDGGSCSVNRTFEALVMEPAQVAEYRNLVAEKRLSIETLWQVLIAGAWLPDGFDEKVEKDRLEQEAAKNPPMDPLAGTRGRFVKPGQPKPGDPMPEPGAKPKPGENDPAAKK